MVAMAGILFQIPGSLSGKSERQLLTEGGRSQHLRQKKNRIECFVFTKTGACYLTLSLLRT